MLFISYYILILLSMAFSSVTNLSCQVPELQESNQVRYERQPCLRLTLLCQQCEARSKFSHVYG